MAIVMRVLPFDGAPPPCGSSWSPSIPEMPSCGRQQLQWIEVDQSHVAEDILNLLLESLRGLLSLANASTCDLMNLIDDRLVTVPEHLPLVTLLLPLCLLLNTGLFLLKLLSALVFALFKTSQHFMQFLHHSLLPLFFELLLKEHRKN